MSITAVVHPIISAIVKTECLPEIGSNRQWQSQNTVQEYFLSQYFQSGRNCLEAIPEMVSIASRRISDVNRFLRDHGFTIQLREDLSSALATASVLDLLMEWQERGCSTQIQGIDNNQYSAARVTLTDSYESAGHQYPIAYLQTKNYDRVFMTRLDSEPKDQWEVLDIAQSLTSGISSLSAFGRVIFPKVNLNISQNLDWLLGLSTIGADGEVAVIDQALQQTKLRMNEVGARAESAAAISVTRMAASAPKLDMRIDGPFLMWVRRDTMLTNTKHFLFAAYITPEDWSDPGSID